MADLYWRRGNASTGPLSWNTDGWSRFPMGLIEPGLRPTASDVIHLPSNLYGISVSSTNTVNQTFSVAGVRTYVDTSRPFDLIPPGGGRSIEYYTNIQLLDVTLIVGTAGIKGETSNSIPTSLRIRTRVTIDARSPHSNVVGSTLRMQSGNLATIEWAEIRVKHFTCLNSNLQYTSAFFFIARSFLVDGYVNGDRDINNGWIFFLETNTQLTINSRRIPWNVQTYSMSYVGNVVANRGLTFSGSGNIYIELTVGNPSFGAYAGSTLDTTNLFARLFGRVVIRHYGLQHINQSDDAQLLAGADVEIAYIGDNVQVRKISDIVKVCRYLTISRLDYMGFTNVVNLSFEDFEYCQGIVTSTLNATGESTLPLSSIESSVFKVSDGVQHPLEIKVLLGPPPVGYALYRDQWNIVKLDCRFAADASPDMILRSGPTDVEVIVGLLVTVGRLEVTNPRQDLTWKIVMPWTSAIGPGSTNPNKLTSVREVSLQHVNVIRAQGINTFAPTPVIAADRLSLQNTSISFVHLDIETSATAVGVTARFSDASPGLTIDATDPSNVDLGNNINWDFGQQDSVIPVCIPF